MLTWSVLALTKDLHGDLSNTSLQVSRVLQVIIKLQNWQRCTLETGFRHFILFLVLKLGKTEDSNIKQ